MKNGSFFVPREQINAFCNPAAMNAEEGLYLYWQTDPAVARRILPPQLELLDPAHPLAANQHIDDVVQRRQFIQFQHVEHRQAFRQSLPVTLQRMQCLI